MANLSLSDAVCTLRVDADVKVAEERLATAQATLDEAAKAEHAATTEYESKFTLRERLATYTEKYGHPSAATHAWYAGVQEPKRTRDIAELVRDRWQKRLDITTERASRTRILGESIVKAHTISEVGAAVPLVPCPATARPDNVKAEAEAWGDVVGAAMRGGGIYYAGPIFNSAFPLFGSGYSASSAYATYRASVAAIPHSSEGERPHDYNSQAEDQYRQGM